MTRRSGTSVIVAVSLMLILEPVNVSARSLDTRLATYILAGIAGLYTLLTCFCFLLAVCICCNKRHRKSTKKHPYIEEIESPRELHGTVFENKYYVEENEKKVDLDTAIIKTVADKNVTIIANDYVHAADLIKKEEFRNSPLARHTPKIITHPVRVPYSDDTSSIDEIEPGGAPITQISILSWSDSSKKDREDGHGPFELKSLKRRGQAERKTAPSPVKDNIMSKGFLPQNGRLEMEKHRSIPQTNPLPRSGQTKTTDNTTKTVTLTKLCAELSSIAPKWYDLGIQLKVSYKTLNAIRAINKRNIEVCLMRVCEEWLLQEKKCNKFPAWSTIIEVLKSKVISETELAGRIDQKYCNDKTEEESDDEEEPTSKSYTWIN